MTIGESHFPRDWLAYAEEDFARVPRLVRAHDAGLAGFCLQQAIEKFLKAYLLEQGWRLRRTHDLGDLLTEAIAYEPGWDRFLSVCQRITDFYILSRYPFPVSARFTEQDVRAALRAVLPLVNRIRRTFPPVTT